MKIAREVKNLLDPTDLERLRRVCIIRVGWKCRAARVGESAEVEDFGDAVERCAVPYLEAGGVGEEEEASGGVGEG